MLKDLQKSVEEEEHVWKLKMAEEQRQAALDQVKVLEQAAEGMKMDNESTDQLKEQVLLLEAQLEKQLESISFSQTYAEEVAQLKALLTKTQSQLETAQLEEQKQAEELSVVGFVKFMFLVSLYFCYYGAITQSRVRLRRKLVRGWT
ncbi:ribosome-binding protein 1-like isoform X1 [Salmo trutta]|uniref:ribosome-binding protein 1-like isoform X1 n=1 Tax=Salmo trutta TaxID=8032 RepID=UPI00113126B0|nr:ribosome-binding protein 1-like isoform X1 [Salmo trutta]XP_029595377.1 ribosome-binding protein 1-like isoform X1 [Salmo trutta]